MAACNIEKMMSFVKKELFLIFHITHNCHFEPGYVTCIFPLATFLYQA